MDETFFDGVEIREIEFGGGRIRFPIRYYDGDTIQASFLAPVDNVRAILPSEKLAPIQPVPGMAAVTMAGMTYRRVEGMEPYNEFGVMVACSYGTAEDQPALPGAFVSHLPVTTEQARWGGVEIYGFPKFVAEIDFEDLEGAQRCRVHADGKEILTLQVNVLPTERRTWEGWAYTVKGGQLVRTHLQYQGELGASQQRGGATCTLGDHPMAKELRALGMDRISVEHRYLRRVQMMLHAPGEWLDL
jgi:hypothetical protein